MCGSSPGPSIPSGCSSLDPQHLAHSTPFNNVAYLGQNTRILENSSTGKQSEPARPEAKGTEGAEGLSIPLRRDAGPGRPSAGPPRGRTRSAGCLAAQRPRARKSRGRRRGQRRGPGPTGRTPAAASRASAWGRALHPGRGRRPVGTGPAGTGVLTPCFACSSDSLCFLNASSSSSAMVRQSRVEQPRPHSEGSPAAPRRTHNPPHCAGARSAQASPIQPGAAPPASARAPGEARLRDRRLWGGAGRPGRNPGRSFATRVPLPRPRRAQAAL